MLDATDPCLDTHGDAVRLVDRARLAIELCRDQEEDVEEEAELTVLCVAKEPKAFVLLGL